MRIDEFENTVWNVEGIRIVIRASSDDEVDAYGLVRAAPANRTWQWLKDQRIARAIGDKEVVAIDGRGRLVRGNTTLERIWGSYVDG